MIEFRHKHNTVEKVVRNGFETIVIPPGLSVVESFFWCSEMFFEEYIIWYDVRFISRLGNFDNYLSSMEPYELRFAYPEKKYGIPEDLDFAFWDTPFLRSRSNSFVYPTWDVSPLLGVGYGKLIATFNFLKGERDLNLMLKVMAYIGISNGLMSLQDPEIMKIIHKNDSVDEMVIDKIDLYRFIKMTRGNNWGFFYVFAQVLFKKRFSLMGFFRLFLAPSHSKKELDLKFLYHLNNRKIDLKDVGSLDVIIPTIGRAKYLIMFLEDLENQALIPNNVIIIEQNPDPLAETELGYLYDRKWKFNIKHHLISRLGACNARNMAIGLVESDMVFFADDDIRIMPDFLEKALLYMKRYRFGGINCSVYLSSDIKPESLFSPHLSRILSTCSSIIDTHFVKSTCFDLRFEFGFGEDSDYGQMLREKGCLVTDFYESPICHLKAPMGGFRTPFDQPWVNDLVRPKPAPTMLLYFVKNLSLNQFNGYKLFYFLRTIFGGSIFNIVSNYRRTIEAWYKSHYYMKRL